MMKKLGKVLFCRFEEFLNLGNTLTSEKFSETSPVMHINKPMLRSQ